MSDSVSLTPRPPLRKPRDWRTYVNNLSQIEKEKLLLTVLEDAINGHHSDIKYRKGEEGREECLYWNSTGEPLLKG